MQLLRQAVERRQVWTGPKTGKEQRSALTCQGFRFGLGRPCLICFWCQERDFQGPNIIYMTWHRYIMKAWQLLLAGKCLRIGEGWGGVNHFPAHHFCFNSPPLSDLNGAPNA